MSLDSSQRRAPLRSFLGLALILCTLGPFYLWRATWAVSFWTDEIFSVLVSTRSFQYLVGVTTFDAHPPGFYLILFLWFRLGALLGIEPGVLWARLPSFFGWVWLVSACWFGGRYLLGRGGGTLLAWAVAINGQVAYAAKDTRNYSLAIAALTSCLLLMLVARRMEDRGQLGRGRAAAMWTAYGLCASMAMWLHLLSTFVVLYLGLAWVALAVLGRGWRNGFVIGGFVSQAVAALSFVPWLMVLRYQLEYLDATPTEWMSPANFTNWLGVFVFFYPFGRMGGANYFHWGGEHLASIAFLLAPFAAAVWAWLMVPRGRNAVPEQARDAMVAFMVPYCFVSTLWMISHVGIAKVFHADRYPALAVGIFGAALSIAAVYTVRRLGVSIAWAWLLMLPWFVGCWQGQSIARGIERFDGFRVLMPDRPSEGTRLYTVPAGFTPFLANYLPEYDVVPATQLLEDRPGNGRTHVFYMRHWTHILPAEDRKLLALIESGNLAEEKHHLVLDDSLPGSHYSIYLLDGLKLENLDKLHPEEIFRRLPELRDAAAYAVPEQQLRKDGFSVLELLPNGETFVWGSAEEVRVRFNRPVRAGNYTLKMSLLRQPYPAPLAELTFSFDGQGDVYTAVLGEGSHLVTIPVTISGDLQEPVLRVTHPVWRPKDHMEGSEDWRKLSFYFSAAWLMPLD